MRHLQVGALVVLAACVSSAQGDDPAPVRSARPVTVASVERRAPTPTPATPIVPDVPAVPGPTVPDTWTVEHVLALPGSLSTSVGGPNDGRIEGAVAIPERGPGFIHNSRRPNEGARYGTVEMVQALVRAAAEVDRTLPGSPLYINDLGLQNGGDIPHHGSHETGRDVDVLFYMRDRRGNPIPSKAVPLDPQGRGWDFGDLDDPRDDVRMRIDVPRTWRFVRALLEDERAHVQRIFVVEHIRTLLLTHAEQVRAPQRVRDRFADATCQPGTPHDDHLHIRFFCTAEDIRGGCLDGAPMYPWRIAELRRQGVEPTMTRLERRRVRGNGTTPPAPTATPRHHERVEQFLRAREAWMRQPHPGRPYCR